MKQEEEEEEDEEEDGRRNKKAEGRKAHEMEGKRQQKTLNLFRLSPYLHLPFSLDLKERFGFFFVFGKLWGQRLSDVGVRAMLCPQQD